MAITSIGYDGSVNESDWAKMIPLVGSSHYGVAGANDWKVTAHSTMDRGVNIATGTGWGHGVRDTSDATVSLQAAAVSSGDRWDMIVMRRNWSGTGGTSSFQIVQGTSAKQLPARSNTPGTLDEQPIALVRFTAGQTAAQQIIDLRCWGRNGGLVAKDTLVLTYLNELGASVKINGETWSYEPLANDTLGWVNEDGSGPWVPLNLNAGWFNNGASIARARIVGRGAFLHVQADVRYSPNGQYQPIYEGWVIAPLPPGLVPKEHTFVPGTTNTYHSGTVYSVWQGGISVGPFPVGSICQVGGLAALK